MIETQKISKLLEALFNLQIDNSIVQPKSRQLVRQLIHDENLPESVWNSLNDLEDAERDIIPGTNITPFS